ncbi:polyketide cyclase, partial [Mycobacterium sp. ITM-2017-0098]
WSAVPPAIREGIDFPPFDGQHLENSLKHLAVLVQDRG